MISKLVLVRHGSPDYSKDVPDLERPLTDAGLRALEYALPRKLSLLEPIGKVQVWTSPALRARQTATVVARCVKVDPDDVRECDALYAQDRESFLAQMRSETGTLVIVGHVPFMEELFRELSGGSLSFGKGSAACFVFRGEEVSSAELCWYVQGPDAARWESLVEMERQLARAAKRIGEKYEALDQHPKDPEALHDFRVSIRKARALVGFLKPYIKHRQAEQLDVSLSQLQHATSFLRELDTLSEHMEDIQAANGNLALTAIVHQARDDERTRLLVYLKRRNTQRVMREALHGLRSVRWRQVVETLGLSVEEFRRQFDDFERSVAHEFATFDVTDDEETHALRKRMKRLRYVAEAFGGLLTDEERAAGKRGRELQDALGVLCDARVNLRIVKALKKRGGLAGAERDVEAFAKGERKIVDEAVTSIRARQASEAAV